MTKQKLILIIEDDDSIRTTLQEVLEMESFEVIAAENGLDGLKLLKESSARPSFIIIDLYMPVMDGKTFLNEFKIRFPDYQTIPLLIMTAAAPSDYPLDFEPSMILKKPIDIDVMLEKINSSLTD